MTEIEKMKKAFFPLPETRLDNILRLMSQHKDLLPKTQLGISEEYHLHVDIVVNAIERHKKEPEIPIEHWITKYANEFEEATIGILEP